jgi:hypothetical protein
LRVGVITLLRAVFAPEQTSLGRKHDPFPSVLLRGDCLSTDVDTVDISHELKPAEQLSLNQRFVSAASFFKFSIVVSGAPPVEHL